MTDNRENEPTEDCTPAFGDLPQKQNPPSKEEQELNQKRIEEDQERLKKRIEELRKRDPFIYR